MTAQAPAWSPWGSIQTLEAVGEGGIVHVRTATHDGYFVPAELNARIHDVWRVRTGWYGQGAQDHQWAIVALTFPGLFTPQVVAQAHVWLRNTSADAYAEYSQHAEANTVEATTIETSTIEATTIETSTVEAAPALKTKPRPRHPQFRPGGPVATSVWADWHDSVPEGFVGVCAAPDSDPSAQSWFLVPAAEYNGRTGFRFVVDPERHPAWPEHP